MQIQGKFSMIALETDSHKSLNGSMIIPGFLSRTCICNFQDLER